MSNFFTSDTQRKCRWIVVINDVVELDSGFRIADPRNRGEQVLTYDNTKTVMRFIEDLKCIPREGGKNTK